MRTIAASLLLSCAATAAAAVEPPAGLPRSTPEAQGVAPAALLAFVEDAEKKIDALHSLMVLRHGNVVAEGWWGPYRRDDPHVLFSLSKSFTSTGVGLAIAEGKLSLDDTVLSFFPEDAPPSPSDNLKAMRVRDLLSMSSGHHADVIESFPYTDPAVSQTRAFLALPVAHKPGTHFVYNTPASFMLSAIVQKVTGMPLVDYLRPRLFEPLGIRNPKWDASPRGVSLGGFGLSVTTEDIARFGQLYLRRGEWNGRRLLSAEWVDTATAREVSNGSNPSSDWEQGYGYQFWRCRHGLYRGDGAFGQYCIVMPEQDAVVAITSGVRDMQAVLNLVWQHLLPAMSPTPLPADPALRERLAQKLASLSLPPQSGRPTSPIAREVSGRRFELPKNDDGIEAIGLETGPRTTLLVRRGGVEGRVPCGSGEWRRGGTLPSQVRVSTGALTGGAEQPVAATGAWTADDTYTARVCQYETPFCSTLKLWFTGRALVLDQEMNVGFGETKRAQLVGRPIAEARAPAAQPKR
jgi:CubicO group peptidase (beta-lactamase class C family)